MIGAGFGSVAVGAIHRDTRSSRWEPGRVPVEFVAIKQGMSRLALVSVSLSLIALAACADDGAVDGGGDETSTSTSGDGDGDAEGMTTTGTEDPSTSGDGDGDPSGDGDPTTTGDGDGDPTTPGDGDGDPTGDGDGDPEPEAVAACAAACALYEACIEPAPDCVDQCLDSYGSWDGDGECQAAELGMVQCLASLDCDALEQYMDGSPEPYPCQADEEALCDGGGVCSVAVGVGEDPSVCDVTLDCEGEPEVSVECSGGECTCYEQNIATGGCSLGEDVCDLPGEDIYSECCA